LDPDKLIENLRAVLKQEPDELRAFMYNLYYDPLVKLLYDMWGRYLNADALEPTLGAGTGENKKAASAPA
jgi:hypothetical protein